MDCSNSKKLRIKIGIIDIPIISKKIATIENTKEKDKRVISFLFKNFAILKKSENRNIFLIKFDKYFYTNLQSF